MIGLVQIKKVRLPGKVAEQPAFPRAFLSLAQRLDRLVERGECGRTDTETLLVGKGRNMATKTSIAFPEVNENRVPGCRDVALPMA